MSSIDLLSCGRRSPRGNVLGVQPRLAPDDYRSAAALQRRLAAYLALAEGRGWLRDTTIVVFPEYIGTWLVAANGPPAVYRAPTLAAAFRPLIRQHLLSFGAALTRSSAPDRMTAALFRARASAMAHDYNHVFGRLAQRFGITVVAGSIILPDPQIVDGAVTPGRGPLRNVSVVYKPNGKAHDQLVIKRFLTDEEQPFTSPCENDETPVFETPAGRLGVIICADSWYPEAYQPLTLGRAEILAVPAFLAGDGVWNKPWGGYNGSLPPADVNLDDVGVLTEGQAWLKYAMVGRLRRAGIHWGMTPFLRGDLWGLGSDGPSLAARDGLLLGSPTSSAALVNLWLSD